MTTFPCWNCPGNISHHVTGPPDLRATGPPGKVCRSLGQGLSKTWARFVFQRQTVPMLYALHPPLRSIRWSRSAAQKQASPKTTADLARVRNYGRGMGSPGRRSPIPILLVNIFMATLTRSDTIFVLEKILQTPR